MPEATAPVRQLHPARDMLRDPYEMTQGEMITPSVAPRVKEIPRTTTVPLLRPAPTPSEDSMHQPDRATAQLTYPKMLELELTVGVPPLEQLHAERATLVALNSRVKALQRNSIWKDLRDIELARASARFRAEWKGEKAPSEALVTSSAQADPHFIAWVQQLDAMFASYEVVEDRINQINELINRGQALIRYVSSEPK